MLPDKWRRPADSTWFHVVFFVQLNSSSVIYSNTVRYAVPSSSSVITRTEVYYVPVYCVLPRNADPGNNFDTQGRTPSPSGGNSQFQVQLNFYDSQSFQVSCCRSTVERWNLPLICLTWLHADIIRRIICTLSTHFQVLWSFANACVWSRCLPSDFKWRILDYCLPARHCTCQEMSRWIQEQHQNVQRIER